MRRVSVVGGPGAGKTTVASALGLPHTELDALWWGPGWTPVDLATFQRRVREATATDAWVLDGFYLDEATRAIVWPAADTIVWLDLPRRTCVGRALRRSAVRAARRTELWGGSRQSIAALSPRSVVRFVRRWPAYARRIEQALAADAPAATVVRLRSDREVRAWLDGGGGTVA